MSSRERTTVHLETLESRETPTVTIVNPLTATYTDIDGDKVTIKVSSGTLTAGLFTSVAGGVGEQLQLVNFSGGSFEGANLTFSVVKVFGGDGLANVGYINSTGRDLGKVTIKGDLGQIDAGDAITTTPGLQSLSVRSLGRLGLDTQAPGGDLKSDIHGALGALVVAGDVKDASVNVTGAGGKIGAITIGGSLIGGSNPFSGAISSSGGMGAVKIGHDVQGSSGPSSGQIKSFGNLAGVRIGGSLIGGSNADSGMIFSDGDMGAVKIGHDVQGSSGPYSGRINTTGKLAGVSIGGSLHGGSNGNSGEIYSTGDMGVVRIGFDVQGGSASPSGIIYGIGKLAGVRIGGSLIGGSATFSGEIFSGDDLGAVTIGHDLIGGSISGTASLDRSGDIMSLARISSVTIGGSIISGIDNSIGALTRNATIRADNDIGSLMVKGSLIGHGDTGSGGSPVVISARGQVFPSPGVDLAIGKVSIAGRVEFANILAGYDTALSALNGDAQIGAVTVGGDWAASNLVAGVQNAASGNTNFGNAGDALIGGGSAAIVAKIASITIKGQVFGTPNSVSATDHYGFAAQQIGLLKIGGSAVALAAGPDNDNLVVGETSDMTVHEV